MIWRGIETAPRNKAVIVAARGHVIPAKWLIGEAVLRNEGDTDDGWWWANEGPGDYHAQSLESAGTPPLWWCDLPKPPQG